MGFVFGLLEIGGLDLSLSGLKTFNAQSGECEACALNLSNQANSPSGPIIGLLSLNVILEPFTVQENLCLNSH